VTRLVLLAPAGIAPTRPGFIFKAVLFSILGGWGVQRLNRLVFGRQTIHPEALKFMTAIHTHFRARRGKEYLFSDEELKRLSMPTLFLGGMEDALIPVEAGAARLGKLLPEFKARLIPGMGHALINLSELTLPFLTVAE
jgi:pimeloyl-ACP methyl ester carboxylesterase